MLTSTEALVRTAFFHGGRLTVSDWPMPSLTTYHPRNEEGLSSCRSENDHRSCIHACDVHELEELRPIQEAVQAR